MSPTETARGRTWTSTFPSKCLKVGEWAGGPAAGLSWAPGSAPHALCLSYSLAFLCVLPWRVLAERKVSRELG